MKTCSLFLLSGLMVLLAASSPGPPTRVCDILKVTYPATTFLREDVNYINETPIAWSASAWLTPACIFAPSNAEQLSFAVKSLADTGTQFAMRGGGHMPIDSANAIGPTGVLISSSNLNTLVLSADRETLSIGPGPRWLDVYDFLEGSGLAVVGARIGPVGVPGLLLGGGVSFYSYEYGLASTNGNIKGYECVLADGRIIELTATNEYSDLFWALQGGGNSFCLVTRFDLRTLRAPSTMFGAPSYGGSEVKNEFMDAVYNFVTSGHEDPKGAIIPVVQYAVGTAGPAYSSTLFYNGNSSAPEILKGFLGDTLTPLNSSTTLFQFSLGQYSKQVRPAFEEGGQSHGLRQRFHLLPIMANREAMQLVYDSYFEAAQLQFRDVEKGVIGMAFNPITTQLLAASNKWPGSLQGLDQQPAFWIEQTYSWKNAADDAVVDEFIQNFNTDMLRRLEIMNATGSFYYLNEADVDQPVFQNYPATNLQRLKEIRCKYDPERVYTDLIPGGFKVADV